MTESCLFRRHYSSVHLNLCYHKHKGTVIIITTTPTTIYLNDDLKKELTKKLDSLGISLNTYFNITVRQFVLQNHLPFEISDPADIPTEKTEKAMILVKAKEIKLIKDDSVSFDDIDKAIEFLNSEA